MEQASTMLRTNGLDPRTSAVWAKRGYIVRNAATDLRHITTEGRERLRVLRRG